MKVAICTPIHRQVEADFMVSLIATMQAKLFPCTWLHTIGHSNLPKARNWLAASALDQDATDILFIDSDIGWSPEAVAKLFDVDEEIGIVAGVPQRRSADLSFCGLPDSPRALKKGDLVTGLAATAFMRIRAPVLEHLKSVVAPYEHEGVPQHAWFGYPIAPNPTTGKTDMLLEDYAFCQLARDEGIEVWLDPTIPLRHWHSAPLTSVMGDHIRMDDPMKEAVNA